jgi:2-polyprenyl-6-hydroxyphenyl methylase/3-demethylubiquinone-9 3-methyltransferase
MRLSYEAVFDYSNQALKRIENNRINWICSQAKGDTVLDVGCSQGLASILLGREGKQVLGLDYLQTLIDSANELLENEPEEIRSLVTFKRGNFLTEDLSESNFDVILFTDVLEQSNQPELFMEKGYRLLNSNGLMIITVTFGINDSLDQKKTYYLKELLSVADPYLEVEKINFLGKWVSLVGRKRGAINKENSIKFDSALIGKLEENFYVIERELIGELKKHQEENSRLKKDIEELKLSTTEHYNIDNTLYDVKKIRCDLEQILKDKSEVKSLIKEIQSISINFEDFINHQNKRKDTNNLLLVEEKEEKLQAKKELLELHKKYEKNLNETKEILYKFNTLKKSKLGKLTLWYWKVRGRIQGGW